tara:strand:+ start:4997 stop:6634 length:1638 start_codon:yes stop_codon:yes gene_type:complete
MTLISQFLIFYLLTYFSGRGIYCLINRNNNFQDKIIKYSKNIFYPTICLVFLGNLSIVYNFFYKINIYFTIFFYISTIFLNLLHFQKINLDIINFKNFLFLLPIFYIPLSTYNLGFSYDAGLYHLNFQNWLRSEKIIFGLSNLHMRYGYSSIFDYINANFWINENFLLLHFTNILFIIFFFQLISDQILINKNKTLGIATALLIFGFLDNFGINGGKNGFIEIEGITKYDTVFGIVFITFIVLFISALSKEDLNLLDIKFLGIYLIFAIQLRPLGLLLFIPFIYLLIFNSHIIRKNFYIALLAVSSVHFIKNLINSGCLIFPIEPLCFNNLDWYQKGYAQSESANIRQSLRSYSFDENIVDWFYYWSDKNSYNSSTLINYFATIIIIYSIILLFFKLRISYKIFTYVLFGNISLVLIWMVTTPNPRFGIGLFMTSSLLLINYIIDSRFERNLIKNLNIALYCLSLVFFLRVTSIVAFIQDPLKDFIIVIPDNIAYSENKNGQIVRSDNSEQCWVNKFCVPTYSKNVEIEKINLNYKKIKIAELKN